MSVNFRGTGTIMSTRTNIDTSCRFTHTPGCFDQEEYVEAILKRLADSFTEVNITADFLQMLADPDSEQGGQQLTCLIKERIAAIQDQVTELYYALNHVPPPALKQ